LAFDLSEEEETDTLHRNEALESQSIGVRGK
jgi:hypothetical protein